MVNVTCPNCRAEIPYFLIARQLYKHHIHNKEDILKIIRDGAGTSGEVRDVYTCKIKPISQRQIVNLLKQLEREGKISLTIVRNANGKFGCTTITKLVK